MALNLSSSTIETLLDSVTSAMCRSDALQLEKEVISALADVEDGVPGAELRLSSTVQPYPLLRDAVFLMLPPQQAV